MLNVFMFLNYLNFLLYEFFGIVLTFSPHPNAYEYLCLHFYWAVWLLLFGYCINQES